MVEHFANVAIGAETLEITPEFSIANMTVLDAIAKAAELNRSLNVAME